MIAVASGASRSGSLGGRLERELVRAALFGEAGAGPRIGRLRLEGSLGAGASAVVFAAHDEVLDRRVAVKIFARRDHDGRWTAHMQREARALARLANPHVVSVYDVGEWDGHPFISMELVEGETLARWQARTRDPRAILAAYAQAGRGLEAAHRAGLVHRDFKPANVLVAADGRVVVSDFGLAGDTREPGSASPLGTPAYLAPEQAAGAAPDPRADVYSFCMSLAEALLGVYPTSASAPPWPRELGGRVPARVRQALARGLAEDPAARWPSMAPLVAILDPERSPRRRRRLVAGLGAVAVLSAGLVVARGGSDRSPTVTPAASAAVAQAMARLARDPSAAAVDLLAVPAAQRGEEWQVAARSIALAARSTTVACAWPGPVATWIVEGGLVAGLGEDHRVTVCDPVLGRTVTISDARCFRGIDRDSFVTVAGDGTIAVHERRGDAWPVGARLSVPDPSAADAAALAACDLRAGRGPSGPEVTLGPGRHVDASGSVRTLRLGDGRLRLGEAGVVADAVERFQTEAGLHTALVVRTHGLELVDLASGTRTTAALAPGDPSRVLTGLAAGGALAVAVTRDGILSWAARGAAAWQSTRVLGGYTDLAAIAPGGVRVALVHFFGGIEVHDLATGTAVELVDAGGLAALGFADDDTLVAVHRDGRVARWSIAEARARVLATHEGRVWIVATAGDAVASGGKDGTVRIASLASGPARVLALGAGVRVYALRFDGDLLYVGCNEGNVQVWRWREGRRVATLPGHETWAYDVELARPHGGGEPDVITGSKAGALRLWTGGVPTLLVPPAGARDEARVNDVDASTDGRRAAAVDAGGRLYLVDVERRTLVARIPAHRGWARRVAFAATGARVVTVGDDGWLRCWSSADGHLVWQVRAHGAQILDLDVQGEHALTAAADGSVKLWKLDAGQLERSFTGHQDAVISVRLRGDGRWLVSGDGGGRIAVWRTDRERAWAWLAGPAGGLMSVRFAADGTVVSGGEDGTVRAWRPPYDDTPAQLARDLEGGAKKPD